MEKYTEQIVKWYQENKRDLPWRKGKNPYHIWISEIMLQQTRIEAVIGYYYRFLEKIPDIKTLATIEEKSLLKLWEGLGYYNRARNLKIAANQIENEYQGKFPTTYVEIIKLKGIGEYTASAISSICYNEPQVTIDGNVLRVFTRFYNDQRNIDEPRTKKSIREYLQKIIPEESGDFNQGLMEIGETICIPNGIPKCNICPLKKDCLANHYNTYQDLPIRKKKIVKKQEDYTVLIFQNQDEVAIYQRTKESLLNNLWGFPQIEGLFSMEEIKDYLIKQNIKYQYIQQGIQNTHIFTHKKWNMISYKIRLTTNYSLKQYKWKKISEIKEEFAIPTAYKPFLEFLK